MKSGYIKLMRNGAFALTIFVLGMFAPATKAVTFTNNASLQVTSDPSNSLTSVSGVFTVSCWFKLNIPSTLSLSQNMTLLMDRADGVETSPHSYQLRVNYTTGALEFTSKGNNGGVTNVIADGLFVGRWYHVAIVRNGSLFTPYLDGQLAGNSFTANVGTTTGSGITIGGVNGTSRQFFGEIMEVSLYNTDLQYQDIRYMMYSDQRVSPLPANLKAYYKLGYLPGGVDNLTNYVASPTTGTELLAKAGTGTISFPEVDQAGEQSLFDSNVNGGRNAIAPLSGIFSWQSSALSRPTPGIAFDIQYAYSGAIPNPQSGVDDPYARRTLGNGWRDSFDTRVTKAVLPAGGSEIRILSWDGSIETWTQTNTATPFVTRHGEYRGELQELGDYSVEWTTPERLIYHFNAPGSGSLAGRLTEITDSHSNSIQLFWDINAFLTNVVDSVGASYTFNYNGSLLTNVSFGNWQVYFSYDSSNRLSAQWLTNTSGAYANATNITRFYYTNVMGFSLLDRIVDARGFTNTVVSYDKYRRKIKVADALGRATTYEYGVPDTRTIRTTDPDGYKSLTTFDRKGRVISETDPLTNTTRYTYDDAGHRTSITEPKGQTTWFGYDDRGNMLARTNCLGEITRWIFHTNFNKPVAEINDLGWTNHFTLDDTTGDLLSQYDDLGLIVTNVYETNGLLLASTDGRGLKNTFDYDTNGFLISKTNAANASTIYTYNELGWKLSEKNALDEITRYEYDQNGNVVRTVDPLLRTFTKSYDANGNVLSESDAKGALTTYAYDTANQRTNMVDRTGTNVWRYFYSGRGNLTVTLNPLGYGVTNTYDAANRLVKVSAPLGNVIQNYYDPNGNLTNMVDQLGKSWSKVYDDLNRVIVETDPLGNSKFTEYDELGRVKKTTSPNGWSSINEYDDRGRLHQWTDPEGNQWLYDYDANANITNITDALGGHYIMAYGPRNERTLERNQDGKEWHYDYDELGRLKQQTDPNGITRTLDYDDGGRVLSVTFNTGRVNSFAYDDNNNPEVLSRSGSGPATLSQLRYDVMDRVVEYTDAFSKKVKYQYDALGRRSVLTYPDGKTLAYKYDALSRLTNQVDWAGRQLNYAYDAASRLVRRSYPNGVVQTNQFDESGRMTSLTYTVTNAVPPANAINVALSYAYDRNGNKTDESEQGTLDWPIPAKRNETARYTPGGRLMDRAINMVESTNPQPSTVTYAYDASGNLTNAMMASGVATNGQSWSLTYDEDNRTMSIAWDCGITHKDITNRYDAMGRRVSKTVDTTETRYALDLAAGMERILCDMAPNGQILAYYVHGPDLCYKVDAANNVTCYHADAQANIIAVTGAGGTNTAQYAYTPYGRSLGSTNCDPATVNAQPYTFVGSQGVMEDLPGLFFMRARYYSADCGVFLSTDPVKNIGPGWKPIEYTYAANNPLNNTDPTGLFSLGGFVNLVGDVKSPVNFGVIAASGIAYGVGFATGNDALVRRADGGVALVIQNVVKDVEDTTGLTIDGSFNGRAINDHIGDDALANDPGTLNGLKTVMKYGGYANTARSVGDIAHTGIQGAAAIDAGQWGQVGNRIMQSLAIQMATLGVQLGARISASGNSTAAGNTATAGNYANIVNTSTTSNPGSSGAAKGPAVINPLKLYYYDRADAARERAARYSAVSRQYRAVYNQQLSRYNDLMASFSNSDYFTYWLFGSQAKQMSDQAYSQYRNYDRMANRARAQASKYDRMGDNQK